MTTFTPMPGVTMSKATSKRDFTLPDHSDAEIARAKRILTALRKEYPDAHCELDFTSPLELLVATILSAQATDVGVNKATPALFAAFPDAAAYAASSPESIEPFIKTIGLFRNKAKSVHAAATMIVDQFDGAVPNTMPELLQLRGVARKTANVVLGNAFGLNMGVVVDTHVMRISQRFGLTEYSDAPKIEKDLMALFPRPHWTLLSHLMIFHGRRACKARGAMCAEHQICRKFCSNAKT
ncbi:MAG: endonuclease III [Planctomycetota bacterium]